MARSSFLPLFSIVVVAALFQSKYEGTYGQNPTWAAGTEGTGGPTWAPVVTEGQTAGPTQPPPTTTTLPPTTTTIESGPPPLHYPAQCACTSSKVWLDIIVVVEVSSSMTAAGLNQAKALLAPLIGALPLDPNVQMTSRVGIVYFSSRAIIQAQLNRYQSPTEAMNGIYAIPYLGDDGVDLQAGLQSAAEVFGNGSRQYTKTIIVFLTSSNQNGQFADPKPVADQLKSEGIAILTIAFAQTDESKPPDVQFASPGYNFTNHDANMNQKFLAALCETNCFCPSNWFQFGDNIVRKYAECVYPGDLPTTWSAAQIACANTNKGYLADELSVNKQAWLKDLATQWFPNASPFGFWIGLTYVNSRATWDRNDASLSNTLSGGDFTNWAPGQGFPSAAGNCAAEMTYLAFQTKWNVKECSSPFTATFNYMCQRRSCDTDTWCF